MKKLIFIAVMAIFLTSCNGYQLDFTLETVNTEGEKSVVSKTVSLHDDSTYFFHKNSQNDLCVAQLRENGDTAYLSVLGNDVESYKLHNVVLSYYDCQTGHRIINEKTPSFEETELTIDSLLNQIEEGKY